MYPLDDAKKRCVEGVEEMTENMKMVDAEELRLVGLAVILALLGFMAHIDYNIVVFLLIPPMIAFFILLLSYRFGLLPNKRLRSLRSWPDTHELAQIFRRASKYVYVVGGELYHTIWDDDEVIEAIKDAVRRKVKIMIIFGPKFDEQSVKLREVVKEGKISLYVLKERENIHHFRINDKFDTLYHSGGDHSKDIILWFKNRFSGKDFLDVFNRKLKEASEIDGLNF